MTPQIILGAIVLVPVILLMVLRVNATLVFLSLCLGNILVQFVGPEAASFVNMFSKNVDSATATDNDTIKIALLVLPVVLTAVFMIKTVRGHAKLALNVLPSIGVGLLGGLLVVPLLPPDLSADITSSPIWEQLEQIQNLVVGVSALICLFVLWLQRPKTGGHDDKHGKHKG